MVLAAVPMADSSGGGSGLAILLPLVLIVGMIWFMSRNQRKVKQRQVDTVARLQPGTRVITTSGQVGIVDEVEDDYVVLEIAPDVYSWFVKQAIGRVLDDPATALGDADGDGQDGTADSTADGTADGDEIRADDVPDDAAGVQDDVKDGAAEKPQTPPTHTEH